MGQRVSIFTSSDFLGSHVIFAVYRNMLVEQLSSFEIQLISMLAKYCLGPGASPFIDSKILKKDYNKEKIYLGNSRGTRLKFDFKTLKISQLIAGYNDLIF